jgi:hypothetical protein
MQANIMSVLSIVNGVVLVDDFFDGESAACYGDLEFIVYEGSIHRIMISERNGQVLIYDALSTNSSTSAGLEAIEGLDGALEVHIGASSFRAIKDNQVIDNVSRQAFGTDIVDCGLGLISVDLLSERDRTEVSTASSSATVASTASITTTTTATASLKKATTIIEVVIVVIIKVLVVVLIVLDLIVIKLILFVLVIAIAPTTTASASTTPATSATTSSTGSASSLALQTTSASRWGKLVFVLFRLSHECAGGLDFVGACNVGKGSESDNVENFHSDVFAKFEVFVLIC